MHKVFFNLNNQSVTNHHYHHHQQQHDDNSDVAKPATNDDNSDVAKPATNDDDQKIILGNITIPINSKTQLSLEMPDSKITVEPNQ